MERILVVDDEPGIRKALSLLLKKEGYDIITAGNGVDALNIFNNTPVDLVISDLKMVPITGIELLKELKKIDHTIEVIMITAFGTIESAVNAMKEGASDYITKPFNSDELIMRVRSSLEKRKLRKRLIQLEDELTSSSIFFGMVGKSKELKVVFDTISRVALTESTVLITGESGTGKELVARSIHELSNRKRRQLVTVNCAAIPESLLESELFGYEKGAFTGAQNSKRGLFEEADGSTIFLDEIGSAPLSIQAKLLRVLESGEIRKLGSTKSGKVDVRVITATNKNLQDEVKKGNFRDDLLYRLQVVEIHMPPLRERREDIPLLVQHFLNHYRLKLNKNIHEVSPEAMELLMKYDYPGNVRELENIIEQAIVVSRDSVVTLNDLPGSLKNGDHSLANTTIDKLTLKEIEKRVIINKLKNRGNNLNIVARELGISRTTLWRKMKELGLVNRKTFQF
jgi:DNA-binding NtrC family response regulator